MKTIKEIAEIFEVSDPTVRNWLKSGKIPTWKQKLRDRKTRTVMKEEDVQAYLDERECSEDVSAIPLTPHIVVDDNYQEEDYILIPIDELEKIAEWDKGIVQNTWSAYLDLLLMAGKKGEISIEAKWLCDRWRWSEERLQKFIKDLSAMGFIRAERCAHETIFTILDNKLISIDRKR